MAFSRDEADFILAARIIEPALTDAEFEAMNTQGDIYQQLAKIIQEYRGGIGYAYKKLEREAQQNGVSLEKKEYNNIFIGAAIE